MKRFLMYVLIAGLLLIGAMMIYMYREYMGQDIDLTANNFANPIIYKRLNAIVTSKSAARAGNPPTFDVAYTDMETNEESRILLNDRYQASIHVGDTLTKEEGEKILLIYQKDGKIATVPID